MGIKSRIINGVARRTTRRIDSHARRSALHQKEIFHTLIKRAAETHFGKEYGFSSIKTHHQYRSHVPVLDYEDYRPFIERIISGEKDVLWPGRPFYFAKTSGTTSGVKYIPITKESIPNHVGNAKDALFNMASRLKLKNLFEGKMIFLSGSPVLEKKGDIPTGRLSGIVNHWIPSWLRTNQLPSLATNSIEDWETKVDRIAHETIHEDMRLISGIPPWVQMYFERLLAISGKTNIKEVFPNFQLFVYGGVNFEPYRIQLENLIGEPVNRLETYPASEGFIAYQDLEDVNEGLLLQCNSGIFYEFIPVTELNAVQPVRLTIDEVQTGIQYALILSTNAGLWSYNIGDTIEFISVAPPRLKVTGRIKHYISAFGEHVIAKEVEEALRLAMQKHACTVNEFTVAPQVNPPGNEKPYHEWWIEFGKKPGSLSSFASDLNESMVTQNLYYEDLVKGKILQPLRVRMLPPGTFRQYMQSVGKLGGQNKVPRLSNDRAIADVLEQLINHSPGEANLLIDR